MNGNHPTILITDDAKVNRAVIRQCLDGYGYQFLEAANGQEALRTIETQKVDLVILDLVMPVMDGFTMLKQVKNDSRHAAIPVIVNSSLEDISSIRRALTLGSYDYFLKSLPREQLLVILPLKVRNAIHSKRLWDDVCLQKEMLERELEAAGRYQRFLLPKNFKATGMEIETFFHPYIGVGGDFFDCVPLQGEKTALMIADVSGHGVLPAMITAILKPLFRQYIQETESPRETVRRLNDDFLTLTDESDYITTFVAVYDPGQRTLRYVNAGHPPPLYLRQDTGELAVLSATRVIMGIFASQEWVNEEIVLSATPASRLLLVTDGVSESRSASGGMFGQAGLEKVLCDMSGCGLAETVRYLWQSLREFTGDQFRDDVTCLAVDFTEVNA